MTLNNLPTALMGFALIALLGGCCTSGSCGSGSASCSSNQVYSAPSAPASDCGCGCSAATDSAMSYGTSGAVVSSDEYYSPPASSTEAPYAIGETISSVSTSPTSIIDAPAIGEASGFTAGSASKLNSLPGNLLPGN